MGKATFTACGDRIGANAKLDTATGDAALPGCETVTVWDAGVLPGAEIVMVPVRGLVVGFKSLDTTRLLPFGAATPLAAETK